MPKRAYFTSQKPEFPRRVTVQHTIFLTTLVLNCPKTGQNGPFLFIFITLIACLHPIPRGDQTIAFKVHFYGGKHALSATNIPKSTVLNVPSLECSSYFAERKDARVARIRCDACGRLPCGALIAVVTRVLLRINCYI